MIDRQARRGVRDVLKRLVRYDVHGIKLRRRVTHRNVDDVHLLILGHGFVAAVASASEVFAELGEGL